jgi:hypothetical protein
MICWIDSIETLFLIDQTGFSKFTSHGTNRKGGNMANHAVGKEIDRKRNIDQRYLD